MKNPSRPLSPHVQVYRPQLTSVLSFSHRLSGLFLSLGAVLLVAWLLAAVTEAHAFVAINGWLGSPLGLLLLFVWTLALFFHLCNGIRHLLWDAVLGFELKSIYLSGWIVVFSSVGLTLVTWALALWQAG
ncbi:MAG TPA: succinate dehydrogenase, cytochrome b556 subunit [Halomonas sp.]|nr:succinate dehydrogenase, cytochrome b556 subunit [Halomonas sp.]